MEKNETIKLVKVSVKEVPFTSPAYYEAVPRDTLAWVSSDLSDETVKEVSFEKKEYPVERIGFKVGDEFLGESYYILKEDKDRLIDLLNGFLGLQKRHIDTEVVNDFITYLAFQNIVSLRTLSKIKDEIMWFKRKREKQLDSLKVKGEGRKEIRE